MSDRNLQSRKRATTSTQDVVARKKSCSLRTLIHTDCTWPTYVTAKYSSLLFAFTKCVRVISNSKLCSKDANTQPFNAYRLLYVPPGLTSKNFTLWSHCLCVFCMDFRTSSTPFRKQHSQTGFYNRGRECLQLGTD